MFSPLRYLRKVFQSTRLQMEQQLVETILEFGERFKLPQDGKETLIYRLATHVAYVPRRTDAWFTYESLFEKSTLNRQKVLLAMVSFNDLDITIIKEAFPDPSDLLEWLRN